jgi:hypothetical protein
MFKNCDGDTCQQWAQWKAEDPETKAILFLCGQHEKEFRERFPKAKIHFCGAVPLSHVSS